MGFKEDIDRLLAEREERIVAEEKTKAERLRQSLLGQENERIRLQNEREELAIREIEDKQKFTQIQEKLEELRVYLNNNSVTGRPPWGMVWIEGDAGESAGHNIYDDEEHGSPYWIPLIYRGWALAREVDVTGLELKSNPVHKPPTRLEKVFGRENSYSVITAKEFEEDKKYNHDYLLIFFGQIDGHWMGTLMDGMNDQQDRIYPGHHFSDLHSGGSWTRDAVKMASKNGMTLGDSLEDTISSVVSRLPEFKQQ